jgi:hypothetical protein
VNTIDEFRNALHDAVDHGPASTVDTTTVTSGALRRQRRWMAIGTTGIAGLAVLALGASAQTTVATTAAPPAVRLADPAMDRLADPKIKFQKPDVTVPTNGTADAFTTERGDKIQLTNAPAKGSKPLDGLGLVLTDGSDPTRGLEFHPNGWQLTEPPVGGLPVKGSQLKAARVRTSHGVLVLGLASESVDAYEHTGDADRPRTFTGRKIVGAKKAAVFWSYVSDKEPTQLVVVITAPKAGSTDVTFTMYLTELKNTAELK